MSSKRQMQALSKAGVMVGWLVVGSHQALAGNVSIQETHTNSDSLGRPAIGLEFEVAIPVWEAEDYWIETYDIDVTDKTTGNPLGGSRNDTYEYNSQGHRTKIKVKYTNVNPPVAFQGRVAIACDLLQNDDANEARLQNFRFQYQGVPEFVIVVPDHGYYYPTLTRFGPGPYYTNFVFENAGATPITIDQIQFWECNTWCGKDVANCACVAGTPSNVAGPITCNPDTGCAFGITINPDANGYIYAKMDMNAAQFGSGIAWYFGHEDAVHAMRRLGVPTVSAWGLACMTLVLLAAGTVIVRRRAEKAAC